jgi:hypothetical protein
MDTGKMSDPVCQITADWPMMPPAGAMARALFDASCTTPLVEPAPRVRLACDRALPHAAFRVELQ